MADKIALVTGAGKGIGASCAQHLAKSGYRVAVHYRSHREQAQQVAADLPGSEIFAYDLAQAGSCEALVKEVKSTMGDISLLVNNAGCSVDQVIPFAKPEDFDRVLASNLRPVFMLSKIVSRMLIKKKSGSIINISSVVGHTGNAGQSIYSASKGAITSFTKSIAQDLASFGVRCNCVAPGFIETQMTAKLPTEVKEKAIKQIPLARFGHVNDVAEAVAFLASDAANYITGTTIHVNGGMFMN